LAGELAVVFVPPLFPVLILPGELRLSLLN